MAVPHRFAHKGRLYDHYIHKAYQAEMWILAVLLVVQFVNVSWITHQRTRGSDTLKRVLQAIVALLLDSVLLFCIFRIAALAMFNRALKEYKCADEYYCDGEDSRTIAQALYGLTLPLLLLEYVRMLRRCLDSADPEHRIPHWGVLRVSMSLSFLLILIALPLFLVNGLHWKTMRVMAFVGLGFLLLGFLCTIIQSFGVNGKGDKRGRVVSRLLQILLPIFTIRLIWLGMDVLDKPYDGHWSDKWKHTAGLEIFMDLLAVVLLIAARLLLGADPYRSTEGVSRV